MHATARRRFGDEFMWVFPSGAAWRSGVVGEFADERDEHGGAEHTGDDADREFPRLEHHACCDVRPDQDDSAERCSGGDEVAVDRADDPSGDVGNGESDEADASRQRDGAADTECDHDDQHEPGPSWVHTAGERGLVPEGEEVEPAPPPEHHGDACSDRRVADGKRRPVGVHE